MSQQPVTLGVQLSDDMSVLGGHPNQTRARGAGSREFEDALGQGGIIRPLPERTAADDGETRAERMRSRAGRLLRQTRSFAPIRRSRSGVIDENAVPDPDVILLADAVLAARPPLSQPRSLPSTPRGPDDGSAAGSSFAVTQFLRIGSGHRRDHSAERDGQAAGAGAYVSARQLGAQEDGLCCSRCGAAAPPSGSSSTTTAVEGARVDGASPAVGPGTCSGSSGGLVRAHSGEAAGPGLAGVGGADQSADGACASGAAEEENSGLRRRVEVLSAQLAASQAALRSAEAQSLHWQVCVRDLFNGLLLSPRMNAKYELKVSKMLESRLAKLDQIECVRYVKCSFPSVASEAPELRLIRWVSLEESQWEVTFAPSWRIELCLEGRQIVPFKLLVRVGSIRVSGELRVSFGTELMRTLLSFNQMPSFDMHIDSQVSLGSVPMPLQRGASALIRHELRKWIEKRAVAPHALCLKRSPPDQAAAATDAACAAQALPTAPAEPSTSSAPHTPANSIGGSMGGLSLASTIEALRSAGTPFSAGLETPTMPASQGGGSAPSWLSHLPSFESGAGGGFAFAGASAGSNEGDTTVAPALTSMGAADEAMEGAARPQSKVSDEDLRCAILAALIKHDNPHVGVARARGRGLFGRSKV